MRHPHHFKIAIALAISAGAWGIYWLPQRILEEGGLTGGWGTIAQMIIGVILLLPIVYGLYKSNNFASFIAVTSIIFLYTWNKSLLSTRCNPC